MKRREFAVIGLGRFGSAMVKTLVDLGHSVLAVDKSEHRVQRLIHTATHAVQADCSDEEALRSLGMRNFEVVIVAIGGDLEDSVLVTLSLKEMGVQHVVAKAASDRHGKLLDRIGADRVVYPERDMAIRVAKSLAADNVLDLIEITPEISIEEISAQGHLVDRTLQDLDLRARFGVTIMAIRHGSDVHVSPPADYRIRQGDILVAIGSNTQLEHLEDLSNA